MTKIHCYIREVPRGLQIQRSRLCVESNSVSFLLCATTFCLTTKKGLGYTKSHAETLEKVEKNLPIW